MKLTRARYQYGCLTRERRRTQPAAWVFRWREAGPDGRRVHRKAVVGTVEEYPTRSAALNAAEALRANANQTQPRRMTVAQLAAHYMAKELPGKAYSRGELCRSHLKMWVVPKWGKYKLSEVKPVTVEEWLKRLPLADATKATIRNLMHVLFQHAMRHELADTNPITLVRQSAKRERVPEVLTVEEVQKLLAELDNPFRLMVFLAATTGLRVSELLALQWHDLDFAALEINLRRAIVDNVVGEMKTEASRKPLPLHPVMAEALASWRKRCAYNQPQDWVFASPQMRGQQPYWPDSAMRKQVRPAAKRAGIAKRIGWHTFRHTCGTLLKANGEDVKVVQELLRHQSSKITMDIYVQAVTPAKRRAQGKVVEMFSVPFCSHAALAGERYNVESADVGA